MIGDVVYIGCISADEAVKCRVFTGTNAASGVGKVFEQYVPFYSILRSAEHTVDAKYQNEE